MPFRLWEYWNSRNLYTECRYSTRYTHVFPGAEFDDNYQLNFSTTPCFALKNLKLTKIEEWRTFRFIGCGYSTVTVLGLRNDYNYQLSSPSLVITNLRPHLFQPRRFSAKNRKKSTCIQILSMFIVNCVNSFFGRRIDCNHQVISLGPTVTTNIRSLLMDPP